MHCNKILGEECRARASVDYIAITSSLDVPHLGMSCCFGMDHVHRG